MVRRGGEKNLDDVSGLAAFDTAEDFFTGFRNGRFAVRRVLEPPAPVVFFFLEVSPEVIQIRSLHQSASTRHPPAPFSSAPRWYSSQRSTHVAERLKSRSAGGKPPRPQRVPRNHACHPPDRSARSCEWFPPWVHGPDVLRTVRGQPQKLRERSLHAVCGRSPVVHPGEHSRAEPCRRERPSLPRTGERRPRRQNGNCHSETVASGRLPGEVHLRIPGTLDGDPAPLSIPSARNHSKCIWAIIL